MNGHKRDVKYNYMAIFGIRRDAQVTWKETRLPGDVVGLFGTRTSQYINFIVSEGVNINFAGGDNRNDTDAGSYKPF